MNSPKSGKLRYFILAFSGAFLVLALMGLVAGTLCMTAVGVIINYAVLLPAYSFFYQLPMEVLIGMGTALIPFITDKLTFVLLATTPFNIIKGILVSVLTVLLYKRISPLLHS